MNQSIQKQMLCLSLHHKGEEGYIRFEIEPYCRKKNRIFTAENIIDSCDKGILLRDNSLKEKLAFRLILRLMVTTDYYQEEGVKWAQILYPHYHKPQMVIRNDEEHYKHKPRRKYLEELKLFSIDVDEVVADESFKLTLAERVLKYLPISEELCMYESEPIDA